MAPPVSTPCQRLGMKGFQLAVFTYLTAKETKITMATSLIATIRLLASADSRMPITSNTVSSITIVKPGRLKCHAHPLAGLYAGTSRGQRVVPVQQDVDQRGLEQRGILHHFSVGRGAGENEYPRANDRADAQSGQAQHAQRFLQPALGGVGIGNQLINALNAEE